MECEKKGTLETNLPVEALCEVLDHYWRAAVESFREAPTSSHILHELAKVADWLTGGSGRTATDFAGASSLLHLMGWRAGGIAAKTLPPEASPPKPEVEPEAAWVHGWQFR